MPRFYLHQILTEVRGSPMVELRKHIADNNVNSMKRIVGADDNIRISDLEILLAAHHNSFDALVYLLDTFDIEPTPETLEVAFQNNAFECVAVMAGWGGCYLPTLVRVYLDRAIKNELFTDEQRRSLGMNPDIPHDKFELIRYFVEQHKVLLLSPLEMITKALAEMRIDWLVTYPKQACLIELIDYYMSKIDSTNESNIVQLQQLVRCLFFGKTDWFAKLKPFLNKSLANDFQIISEVAKCYDCYNNKPIADFESTINLLFEHKLVVDPVFDEKSGRDILKNKQAKFLEFLLDAHRIKCSNIFICMYNTVEYGSCECFGVLLKRHGHTLNEYEKQSLVYSAFTRGDTYVLNQIRKYLPPLRLNFKNLFEEYDEQISHDLLCAIDNIKNADIEITGITEEVQNRIRELKESIDKLYQNYYRDDEPILDIENELEIGDRVELIVTSTADFEDSDDKILFHQFCLAEKFKGCDRLRLKVEKQLVNAYSEEWPDSCRKMFVDTSDGYLVVIPPGDGGCLNCGGEYKAVLYMLVPKDNESQ